MYWLFENDWKIRKKKIKLRSLCSSDEEYLELKIGFTEVFQEKNHLINSYFKHYRRNIIEYVEPCHLPKDLVWRLGLLLVIVWQLR